MLNLEQARFNMVEQQIRPWKLFDNKVLDLMEQVKREDFVPAAYAQLAYADIEIPLGHDQCMLEPRMEARLLQDLAIQPHETVLEIGTGSGYMAALIGRLARRVESLEINAELAAQARANLQRAGISNVEVRHADGASALPAAGSYDVIALSGSVAQVPQNLLKLLSPGGRLAAIVGQEPVMRATVVTRGAGDTFTSVMTWDTVAPRLQNFPEASPFRF